MRCQSILVSVIGLLLGTAALAQEPEPSLFDNVVKALQKNYFDKEFRQQRLPELIQRHEPAARSADTLEAQRNAVHALLADLPATHMGLLSKSTHQRMMGELMNKIQPTFGFELIELDGKQFAHNVLEGGPAEKAGLKRGDRVVSLDGVPIASSKRLDWRSDDAFLPDPAVRGLLADEGDRIKLEIERNWGESQQLEISAEPYSAFQAAKASARIVEVDHRQVGYIHFWFIHLTGVADVLKEKLEGDFADCDALVLDLRGRGGNGAVLKQIREVLSGEKSNWSKPVVALINQYSRSAKEVLAHELQKNDVALLVGEKSAGAVIPATFVDVGYETILMFPTFKFGPYTDRLEGIGVTPDIIVQDAGAYSAGADPILERGLQAASRLAGLVNSPSN